VKIVCNLSDRGLYERRPGLLKFLHFQWDPMNRLLYRDEERVHLRPKTAETLRVFLERPGELISKGELKAAIWPESRSVEDNSVDSQIAELRRILGDSAEGSRLVETVPKRGYRFIGQITAPLPSDDPPLPWGPQVSGAATDKVAKLYPYKGLALILGGILFLSAVVFLLGDFRSRVYASPRTSDGARLYDKGLRALQFSDAPTAQTLLEEAAKADAGSAFVHSALAEALFALGYESRAREEGRRALDISERFPKSNNEDRLFIEARYFGILTGGRQFRIIRRSGRSSPITPSTAFASWRHKAPPTRDPQLSLH
jgi:DNA-binding winged helix-turn-helix (wHTH) protein